MKLDVSKLFAVVATAAAFAGCAGGRSALPPAGGSSTAKAQRADVAFTILVPKARPSSSRRAQYISVATKSVTVNGAGYNVTPSSPGCSTISTGIACTFQLKVFPGNAVPFTVTTFDQPLGANGQVEGNQLSTGTTTAAVVEGKSNTVKVTLLGTPGQVQMSLTNPPMGTAANIPLSINVFDADGYAIVGPWSANIQLTADPYLSFQVNGQSTSLVSAASDSASIVYSGNGVRTATIRANVQMAAAGTYIGSTTFAPIPAFGSEIPVGTSLVNATAYQDASYQHVISFTEPAKAMFAQYIPGGSIQEFHVPSGASPYRLYQALGNFHFTESNNSIGSFFPMTNTINEHVLTNANAGPYDIRASALSATTYVTEKTAGGLAIITAPDPLAGGTPGPDAFYTSGASQSSPAGLAYAGNGLWYADPAANEIGFMTTAGGITRYPVPSAGAQPTEMTDSDGNGHWWFTEPGVSKIASFDANANIVEYPSPGIPKAIVATQSDILVLTTAGLIEDFSESTGALLATYTPPSSSNGPAVWIDAGGIYGTLLVLRSDGTNGAIQILTFD